MYQISIIDRKDLGKVTSTRQLTLKDFKKVILSEYWAPAVFNGRRTITNAIATDFLVLDVDGTATIEKAQEDFRGYAYIIATTKSHTMDSHHFRLILFLNEPIKSDDDFKATFEKTRKIAPYIDVSCKDISRFFYPGTQIIVESQGDSFLVTKSAPRPLPSVSTNIAPEIASKGVLWKSTLQFLLEGAMPGSWHFEMHKAIRNMREQNYTEDEVIEKLEDMCTRSKYSTGTLDKADLKLIQDVFQKRETRYEFEPQALTTTFGESEAFQPIAISASDLLNEAFDYLSDKEQVKGESSGISGIDNLLGGGFRAGEITVLMAEAKTGKNTLYHYLMHKQLKSGLAMGYASRELDPAREVIPNLLSLEFQKSLWTEEITKAVRESAASHVASWNLWFAPGYGYFSLESIRKWFSELTQKGVKHFWMDHLHYMLEEPEEHKHASKLIKELKTIAKQLDIHINLIVQPNKLIEGARLSLNTIKGGSAIGQALDNLFILERIKGHKNISRLRLEVGRHKLCKLGEIFLQYNHETTSFMEVEKEIVVEESMPSLYQNQRIPRTPREWNSIY